MNLIQFLAMKLHQGPLCIDGMVNSTEVVKSVVVPETIDAVPQLILQDRHVTYREIETTLGITGTSIHSILHEHLNVKKNLFALDPTQFVNRGASKCVYDIVTGDESWIYAYEPESKQQSTVRVFQDKSNDLLLD